jgi:hypothetical protein
MSTPQEIQNQPTTNKPVDEPMDLATAVGQLRGLVCGLGAGLLVVSLMFTAFVYKQNRNLSATTVLHQRQITQLQATEAPLGYLLNELAKYSAGKPELAGLFARHGVQLHPPGPAAPAQPTPQR